MTNLDLFFNLVAIFLPYLSYALWTSFELYLIKDFLEQNVANYF